MGGVQYRGGISWVPLGDILSTVRVFSTVGGYHEYRGVILSTVGDVQYRGGKNLLLFEYPTVLNTPHGTHDIPHGTQISKDGIPPRYWTPPRYSWYPPTCIISPTVLSIPHGTQDNPPRYSWYPPRYWTPPRYSRYPPTFIMISPHGTQDIPPRYSWYPPTVLKISPTVLMISPTVLNTPTVLSTPHGTAHTLYRVSTFQKSMH